MIMSSSLRSLFAVAFLFAGMTGCAAPGEDSEPATEETAEDRDQKEEASQVKVEENLAIQKKPIVDLAGRPENPKK
jgi:hypothetical protein